MMEYSVQQHIDDLIIQLLGNELNEKDKEELCQWVNASEANKKYFMDRQEIWFSSIDSEELAKYDGKKAYQLFLDRVEDARRDDEDEARHAFPSRWLAYAAVLAAFCIISYVSYHHGQTTIKSDFANIVIEAPQGSRTKLNLPDGTVVWLNAGSKIAYSQGFGLTDRQVMLTGEGYFEVKKNEKLPFSVKSENLQVNDIGTIFNFSDYPNDAEAVVSLLEGKVSLNDVKHQEKVFYLNPHDQAIFNKSTGNMVINTSAATQETVSWTSGKLILNGQPFGEIVKVLERSYNVKIIVANPNLNHYHFYGDFLRQEESLTDILNDLSATGKLHYKMKDKKTIILY